MIPHNRLTYGEEEVHAAADVVRSGYWVAGQECARLEADLADCFSFEHAIAVASGSASLRLAMQTLGVGSGDEVIVPAYSCVALANAALALGAKPVSVDVLDGDWNIDPDKAEATLTSRTRAIVAVNTFGLPARTQELLKLGIPLIEDIAHGFALADLSRPEPNRAEMVVTSFYATKLMGAGQGGAILTNNFEKALALRDWRDYTDKSADGRRFNDQMTDIEAAIALCQLKRLPMMLGARRRVAAIYNARLTPLEASGTLRLPGFQPRVWYRYVIEPQRHAVSHVLESLRASGIGASRPVEPWSTAETPVATKAFDKLVSLPIYPTLSEKDAHVVCDALIETLQRAA